LEEIGDKWTLIIIRDLLASPKTNKELQEGDEGIPSNILASRLKSLVDKKMVKKTIYHEKPQRYRYELTEKGKALWPVLRELMRWGECYIPEAHLSKRLKRLL